jgi:hypothetical protein
MPSTAELAAQGAELQDVWSGLLDALGSEGWEMFTIESWPDGLGGTTTTHYFKRRLDP